MEKMISAAEANRRFSEVLRGVRGGDSYVVTAHGQPVAKIVPFAEDKRKGDEAKAALLEHLRAQTPMNIGSWTRDELYDDEP